MTTPKACGPSFAAELAAANIPAGLPFSWDDSGAFSFGEGIAPEYIAAIEAVYAAHDPPDTFAVTRAAELAQFRKDRREMFSVISGMGFDAIATGDTATRDALVIFRTGVKDLPEWPAVVAASTLQQLKAAMSARYKSLTNALPPAIKADFKKLYP